MRIVTAATVVAMVLTGCRQAAPSVLDGHVAVPDPHHVLVQGETSLPDKAQILVSLQNAGDHTVVAQGLPLVDDGRFQTLLNLPHDTKPGRYAVRLTFSPAAYDWSQGKVLRTVGRKGEHLRGPWTVKDGDLTILQRDLPLTLPPTKGRTP